MDATAVTRDPDAVRRLNETLERCRVLSQERTGSVRTSERAGALGAVLGSLCSRWPPPEDEARALISLAFAGWCWRAAEVGGSDRNAADVRHAHAATLDDDSVPRHLVATATALRFLTEGGEPGLGSPGRSDEERVAFLDAAFLKFHATYGEPVGIDRDAARYAFRHGVALHDVERIIENLESPLAGL